MNAVHELGRKMFAEFMKMRVRTRLSICIRLGLVVFMVIVGVAQIVYTVDAEQTTFRPLRLQ